MILRKRILRKGVRMYGVSHDYIGDGYKDLIDCIFKSTITHKIFETNSFGNS